MNEPVMMAVEASLLQRLAHATVQHYQFLQRQEIGLPPTELELLKAAREVEARASNELWKAQRTRGGA